MKLLLRFMLKNNASTCDWIGLFGDKWSIGCFDYEIILWINLEYEKIYILF